jgi:hypothetical protein
MCSCVVNHARQLVLATWSTRTGDLSLDLDGRHGVPPWSTPTTTPAGCVSGT